MIAVVMEERCCDTKSWQGTVGAKLAGTLYINLAHDGETFERGIDELVAHLQRCREVSARAEHTPRPRTKTLLVVGECGDGKSTLINALRDEYLSIAPDMGAAARGVTSLGE